MPKTVAEILKQAGLTVPAPAATKIAAAPTTPTKVAEMPPQLVAAMEGKDDKDDKDDKKSDGKDDKADKKEDKDDMDKTASIPAGQVLYDPALIKTAHQQWLVENGYGVCPDPSKAAYLYGRLADVAKTAALQQQQAVTDQLMAHGIKMAHGQYLETWALGLLTGEADVAKVASLCAATGIPLQSVLKRAQAMKIAAGDIDQANRATDAYFNGALLDGTETGAVGNAADASRHDVMFEPTNGPAVAPSTGPTPAQLRFVRPVFLPNNPGLNHGQEVSGGKGDNPA